MNSLRVDFTPAERQTLERVREQQGLATIQQAAEWLVKTGLRRTMGGAIGRRRVLRIVKGGGSQ